MKNSCFSHKKTFLIFLAQIRSKWISESCSAAFLGPLCKNLWGVHIFFYKAFCNRDSWPYTKMRLWWEECDLCPSFIGRKLPLFFVLIWFSEKCAAQERNYQNGEIVRRWMKQKLSNEMFIKRNKSKWREKNL